MDVVHQLLTEYRSLSFIQKVAVAAIPAMFAITVHEVAHGWVARMRGDRTAEMLGRLTLNPVKHIDPIGTLLVPAMAILFTGYFIGWAKAVPVTVENLKRRQKDMAVVAAAGPAANLAMALFWTAVLFAGRILLPSAPGMGTFVVLMAFIGIFFNLVLGVLNLLPIPPLDGGRVVSALLPGPLAWQYDRIEPYGFIIVFGLLLLGVLGPVIWPPVVLMTAFLTGLVL